MRSDATTLSSDDASAIATRWSSTLQRCVQLQDDLTNQPYSERTDYAWISVCIDHDDDSSPASRDEQTLAARAAVRVWQLLSTCQGFGVRENPRFWRSVFHELAQEAAPPDDATFFQSVRFPRVQLRVAGGNSAAIDRTVALFCGAETTRSEISSELDDAIASLSPFLGRSLETAPLPPIELRLCFDLKQTSTEKINALVERVHDAQRDATFAVRIQSLHPTDYWSRHESDWKYASTLCVPLSQRTLALDTDWMRARDVGVHITTVLEFREAMRWSLQLPQEESATSAGVQHLLFMKGFDDEGMPALCSALPHTQCLESLTVEASDGWASFICTKDIVWLGYALFHPDTSASTWRQLRLAGLDYNYRDSKTPPVLHMMARGNNLLTDWNAPSEFVDGYFTATIRAGAVLRLGVGDGGEQLERATRMDACVASTELAELPEMVKVVVPGFGLASVVRDDIVTIEVRAPGRPPLSALSIEDCDLSREDVETILTHSASTLQRAVLDEYDDLIRWRPSRAALLALLSVVAHNQRRDAATTNAVSRLDRDLVTRIVGFGDHEFCVQSSPPQELSAY